MRKFSENRYLADLYTKDQVQAVFMQELIDRIDNVAKGAGVGMVGDLAAPPPVNAINVKASGEMVHVTLTHAAELTRAIEYHIEADTNPNFTAPHLVRQSSSRSHFFALPGFTDNGTPQKWYLRAYAQYPGSKPSQPLVFGGLANPTPVVLTGGVGGTKLTPLGSTGSGTASTTGQQGGSGRGKFRTSTPKVIRIGKTQASVQPTQTTQQNGGQPVVILLPLPNGNTPPTWRVDQSGGGGVDFNGGTPVVNKFSSNNIAFADTNGNLILKNVAQAVGSTLNPSTTSAGFSVLAEMTITVTPSGANNVLLLFTGSFFTTTAAVPWGGVVAFFKDGVQIGPSYSFQENTSTNSFVTVPMSWIDITPTNASHTYTVQWKDSFTPQPLVGSQANRVFQLTELG